MKINIKIISENNDLEKLLLQNENIATECDVKTDIKFQEGKIDLLIIDGKVQEQSLLLINDSCRALYLYETNMDLVVDSSDKKINYIAKPFQISEVFSFVGNFIREKNALVNDIIFGKILINISDKTVSSDKFNVDLTDKELQILLLLVKNSPKIISKKQVLKELWEYEEGVDTYTVETHVYRLRKKIKPYNYIIKTEKEGYSINNL